MSAPIRKKVAPQIRDLTERNVALRERSMYVIVGDNGRDQVVNLHYMLSKLTGRKPNVLWCYKKELGFSSHTKKRSKEVKKSHKTGLHDANLDDPFDMFQKTTDIRYCFYRDSEQVLGKTFGMCVLQDFEALTPNILCRTIETVEGGGIVVILLRTMSSLRQLYSVAMDMHKKYKPAGGSEEGEVRSEFEPRFTERFILSLGQCSNCIVMDDEMNILPISKASLQNLEALKDPIPVEPKASAFSEIESVAKQAGQSIREVVVKMSRTSDQAKTVLELTQTLSSAVKASSTSSIRRLVALTSGRGRGKSAALGMAIGSAVALGYSNIVVTAPCNENVGTVFEFITKTLEVLEYKPHLDFVEISSKTSSSLEKSQSIYSSQKGDRQVKEVPSLIIVNKNNHRQTIQFVAAKECLGVLGSAEILIIDEAAAIPLTTVKGLITSGNHITLLSSTVHGYEGTGRALSLKLVEEIKRNNAFVVSELDMKTPIRYALNDGIEKWLHCLLCLDSTETAPILKNKQLVSPSECKLYLVNRDALFSHHKATEKFLRNIMSLFVSSHYKNSPDDLMLMSDAPKHHVLALIPPVSEEDSEVPEVYVAIQIAIEGRIDTNSANNNSGGLRPSGDMIPWTLSQQFSDTDFGQLNGIRIVRVAVHPQLARMGYGSEAIRQISQFASLPVSALGKESAEREEEKVKDKDQTSILSEVVKPRKLKKPLLSPLEEDNNLLLSPIDFIGTSFGLTLNLFNFWRKNGFVPLYLRQTQNETTGEFTCMMLKASDHQWLVSLYLDFSMRFQRLLSGPFKVISAELALSIMSCATPPADDNQNATDVVQFLTPYDIKRLRSYSRGETDYHLITDLIPVVADLLFNKMSFSGSLSFLARRVLVGMGSQRKTIDELFEEDKLRISIPQILGILKPTIDKISAQLEKKLEAKVKAQFNQRKIRNPTLDPQPEIFAPDAKVKGQGNVDDISKKRRVDQ